MTPEQAIQYIGLPYKRGGDTKAGFNCWFLMAHIQKEYFNKNIPHVDIENPDVIKATHIEYMRKGAWEIVKVPSHGDVALMKDAPNPHVGVYLDIDGGGILHAEEGVGVNFLPMRYLAHAGYSRTVFYKVHE